MGSGEESKMPKDDKVIDFKSVAAKADMKKAGADADAPGSQFGIGNFFAWAMEKYPKLTLGQLEKRMS